SQELAALVCISFEVVPQAGARRGVRLDSPPAMRLIGLAVILAVGLVLGAEGQQAGKVPRVGYLSVTSAANGLHNLGALRAGLRTLDRKSTRLNSSHGSISYAVFCLKKKNKCQT